MADRIRAHDWSTTPLGPLDRWPRSLRALVAMMVAAPGAQAILWGPEGVLIYNDAYARFAGPRHPGILGLPHVEAWPEIAEFNEDNLQRARAGQSWSLRDRELLLDRGDGPRPVWLDVDYVPVRDDAGRPEGFIAFVTEKSDLVHADRERQAAEERLELALSSGGGIGTWDWDVQADRVTADARFAKIYGVDRIKAAQGAPLTEFFGAIHPDDADRVRGDIARSLSTGEPFQCEYRLTQPEGGPRWVAAWGQPSLADDGTPVRLPGVTFDVTDRRRVTEALEESETRYRTLFQTTETGFCIIEMKFEGDRAVDYRIVEGNAAFERMTGLRDAAGKWVSEIAPGLEPHWFELYGRVARTGEPARFEQEAAIFGRWYDVQALRLGDPGQNRVAILFNDVTGHRQAELRRTVLLDLNDAVRDLTDPAEIAHASSRILAEALNVSRVGYGVMDTAAETITIARDYNAPGVASIAGVIHFRDFGDYIEDLSRGNVVAFADAADDPRVTDGGAALDTISARALINLPLTEQGQVVALLFVNNATPRVWTDDDVALVREVAERVRAATERARVTAALRESESRLRFLDDLTTAAQTAIDPQQILSVITRMTARHLGVTNCAYADMDADQDGFTIRGDWAAPGAPSIVGHYSLADFGKLAVQELGAGRPLIVNDNLKELDPDEAATFQAIGISATICMPLVKEGRLVALMAVHHEQPHVWTPAERATIREVTTRCWAHIERVRDEAALRESEQRFRNIADNSPLMTWVTDPSGWCTYLNKTWYDFTGQAQGEAEGFGWLDAVHPEDAPGARASFTAANAAQTPFRLEFRLRRADGKYRWAIDAASPRFDVAGAFLGYVGSVVDIDERREMEDALRATESVLRELNASLEARVEARTHELQVAHEALRQSQKMEAVGQLTGGIAHDFNNLLAGISGALELLGKRLSEGRLNGMERYIDAAQSSAQRAAALTQRLLAFSRRQTLDPKPIDVNRLIQGMDDLIRRSIGPNVELEVVGAGGLWSTRIDPSQLENALLNLCINARDAMAPDGGRLTIETSNKWLDDRAARARDLTPGQYVSLCVTDTGTGMTPEVQAQVFDPFFTTKPLGQGTGLGLSMIHGFVRQSGGQVRIYSELGKGTTMCLYLPRWTGEVDDDALAPPTAIAGAGHGETVLVIDDEQTVRMLVAEVLGEAGYSVIEAPDGPSGLEILRSDRRIDLLVSDVGLPGGMNGRQVADAARETRPDLKVLFITGYAENAAVGNGLLAPGMEVLTKPFVMADLAAKVTDMIDG